jgi:peptide deformylase
MTVLDIINIDNDPKNILTCVAESVASDEFAIYQKVIDDMIDTMKHLGALGLAAPQIGISKRIFVLADGTVCVNPESIMGSGKVTSHAEGCLSVGGGRFYDVKRIRNVIVRGQDRNGKPITLKPKKKIISIAIQHEIDHLNGRLICEKGKLRN